MAFCRNCGAPMGEGEGFCPKCGQKAEAPMTRSGAAVGGDLVGNLIAYVKDFFSKNVLLGAKRALNSRGYDGSILLGLFLLVFSFSIPVFMHETVAASARKAGVSASEISAGLKEVMPFGSLFGLSIAIGLICLIVIIAAVIVHIRVALKKNVDVMSILNLVGYASIPVIVALLVNMIFGLITPVIPILILVAAIFMQIFVLIASIRDLDETGSSNLFISTLMFICSYFFIALFTYLILKSYLLGLLNGII